MLKGVGMRVICWLLVLPFILFATVSQDTMLERTASGGVRIVLCTGEELVEMIVGADGQLTPAKDISGHTDDSLCDWSIHAQPALDSVPAHEIRPAMQTVTTDYLPLPPLHVRRNNVLAPSARGPPPVI